LGVEVVGAYWDNIFTTISKRPSKMNIEAMKKSAQKAAPGEWFRDRECDEDVILSRNHGISNEQSSESGLRYLLSHSDESLLRILDSSEWLYCSDENLDFIINCQPSKILELISEYERLKEIVNNLKHE
jgi:hypothetical protein